MPASAAISAHQLTKTYRIWNDPAKRLTSPLLSEVSRWLPTPAARALQQRAARGYRDFHALQDVSFELQRGEAVGIVGRNGAGKSTLLQLIAGTLQPTAGNIRVNGRIAALLELGAGFNPDFTGRENVFLSGAVLGLGQKEMEARFDAVAAFADIGDFIEQPVKTYSSGMMMRLAFAVNTCVDPDILIVDEALSVGDAPFQAKCYRRLRQLTENGVSLLFVSHDIEIVRTLCSRALWLNKGHVEKWGEAKPVAKAYEKFCWQEQGVVVALQETETLNSDTIAPSDLDTPPFPANPAAGRAGTGAVTFQHAALEHADGGHSKSFEYDEAATLRCRLQANEDIDSEIVISARFRDLKGNFIYAAHDISQMHRLIARAGQEIHASLPIRLPLHHQDYSVHLAVFGFQGGVSHSSGTYDFTRAIFWDVIEEALFISVLPCSAMPLPGPVHVNVPLTLEVRD